jgi:hypothetical protein
VKRCRFIESFKSKNGQIVFDCGLATGGTRKWSVAEIHGIGNAKTMILKFTFSSEEKNCQFVGDAGAN